MTDEKRRTQIFPIECWCNYCGAAPGQTCHTVNGTPREHHLDRTHAAQHDTQNLRNEAYLQEEALRVLREQAAGSTYDEGKGPVTVVHFACGLPDDQCTCGPVDDDPVLCGSPINPARTGPTGGTTCNYPLGHGKVSPDGVSQTYEHGVKGTSLYWTPWPDQAPKVKHPWVTVSLSQGDGLVGDVSGLEAIRRVRVAFNDAGLQVWDFLDFLDEALREGGKYVSETVREWVTVQ